jgi:hypothetical protein
MADTKISALPASTVPLAGTEVLPIVQSGATVKVAVSDLTAGRAVSMLSLTADTTTLVVDSTNHRVGVGTASPSYNVDIKGVAGTNAYVRVQSNNAGDYSSGVLLGDTVSVRGSVIYDQYYNLLRLSGNSVECLNMGGTGDVKVLAGNLVISTSGKGIDFSATSHPAGMTSELLADYEEGTWTPTQGTGLTVVGSFSSSGSYTKIGRMVTVRGRVSGSTSVAIVANSQLCGGLPFTGTTGAEAEEGALTDNNITQVGVAQIYGATVYSTAITATTRMNFTISYFV